MRALIAAPLLGLSLLGGCAQPQYLLSERTDEAPGVTTSSVGDVPARYTNHPTTDAGTTERVSLHIADGFSAVEQGKIMAAVHEWNHALNGAVRFDVASAIGGATAPGAWSINVALTTVLPDKWNNPAPLAVTLRLPSGGGVIVVYANRMGDPDNTRFGNHDLRGVIVHELGVALGGGNDPILYTARVQDCITKDMVMAVGANRNLSTARLNWCEAGATVASTAK